VSAGADTAPIRWNSTQGQYNAGYIAHQDIWEKTSCAAGAHDLEISREKWLKIESYFLDLLQTRFLKRSEPFFVAFF
jgi:hypothetical protein